MWILRSDWKNVRLQWARGRGYTGNANEVENIKSGVALIHAELVHVHESRFSVQKSVSHRLPAVLSTNEADLRKFYLVAIFLTISKTLPRMSAAPMVMYYQDSTRGWRNVVDERWIYNQ